MSSQRKEKKIKKPRKKLTNTNPKQDNSNQQLTAHKYEYPQQSLTLSTALKQSTPPSNKSVYKIYNDPDLNDDISQYKVIKPLLMSLKQVAGLDPQHRNKLKQDHNHLAQYIFMTQRQKCKYFHQKNLKYNTTMEMPGSLPARKISFKRNFQVKIFTQQQAPVSIRKIKTFRDKYNQKIHYS